MQKQHSYVKRSGALRQYADGTFALYLGQSTSDRLPYLTERWWPPFNGSARWAVESMIH